MCELLFNNKKYVLKRNMNGSFFSFTNKKNTMRNETLEESDLS